MVKKNDKIVRLSEHEIQKQILEYLRLKGIFYWRQNTGRKHYMQFGLKGQGDITGLLKTGQRFEIEVKDHKGKQSLEQKQFQEMIEKNNGIYILARSIDDVIKIL